MTLTEVNSRFRRNDVISGKPSMSGGRDFQDAVISAKLVPAKASSGHLSAPIKIRGFIFTHTSGAIPRHAVLGVEGVQ